MVHKGALGMETGGLGGGSEWKMASLITWHLTDIQVCGFTYKGPQTTDLDFLAVLEARGLRPGCTKIGFSHTLFSWLGGCYHPLMSSQGLLSVLICLLIFPFMIPVKFNCDSHSWLTLSLVTTLNTSLFKLSHLLSNWAYWNFSLWLSGHIMSIKPNQRESRRPILERML